LVSACRAAPTVNRIQTHSMPTSAGVTIGVACFLFTPWPREVIALAVAATWLWLRA
jgi:hypothetical protein